MYKVETKSKSIPNILSLKYITVYIVAFMVSMVPIANELAPFSLSLIAACFANSVPAIGVIVVSLIGNLVKFGIDGTLIYLLTTAVMVITFFIIKPKINEEGRNEQIKMGKNLIVATLIVQLLKCVFTGFTIYDIIASVTFTIIAYVFYKIFVNSLLVIEDFTEKRAFTIEEVIGTSLLITIAFTSFRKYTNSRNFTK